MKHMVLAAALSLAATSANAATWTFQWLDSFEVEQVNFNGQNDAFDAFVNGGAILGHGSGVVVVSRAA